MIKKIILIASSILLFFNISFGLEKINEELFQYVRNSKEKFETIESLHDFLIKPTKTQSDKVEIFFYWISQNIEYDVKGYLSGDLNPDKNPLINQKGVCEDYSNIFLDLCKLSKIECYKIIGYAKGFGYSKNKKLIANHAWNLVKIDTTFKFIDATWGSGYVDFDKKGKLKYFKKLNLKEVFVDSKEFRMNHLPASPRWQLLKKPISYKRFIQYEHFDDMTLNYKFNYHYKDSIEAFKNLSLTEQFITEGKTAYQFNPSSENAITCAIYYNQAGYELAHKTNDLQQVKLAKFYYLKAKKWNAKAGKRKIDKLYIQARKDLINSTNGGIRYCNFKIQEIKNNGDIVQKN